MWSLAEQTVGQPLHTAVSWFGARLHLANMEEDWVESPPMAPASWQDVHRQDTARLAHLGLATRGVRKTISSSPASFLSTTEIGWLRQNAPLVHLLRTGQWEPVPSSPPDCWARCLAIKSSGVTIAAARKILMTALEAVPCAAKAAFPEPLSAGERAWAQQNSTTVHDLYSGQLRGMPTSPSRTWVSAFQAAVGGTKAEIATILSIIVNIIHEAQSAMVAAE